MFFLLWRNNFLHRSWTIRSVPTFLDFPSKVINHFFPVDFVQAQGIAYHFAIILVFACCYLLGNIFFLFFCETDIHNTPILSSQNYRLCPKLSNMDIISFPQTINKPSPFPYRPLPTIVWPSYVVRFWRCFDCLLGVFLGFLRLSWEASGPKNV